MFQYNFSNSGFEHRKSEGSASTSLHTSLNQFNINVANANYTQCHSENTIFKDIDANIGLIDSSFENPYTFN